MDVSVRDICTRFKFFDTSKKRVELNTATRKLLGRMGLFPNKFNAIARVRLFLFIVYTHGLAAGSWGHLIHFLANNPFSFFSVADDIATILTTECVTFLFILLVKQAPEVQKMFDRLGDFTDPEIGKPAGVEALEHLIRKCIRAIVIGFASTGVATWCLYTLETCEPGEVSACGFIFEPYLPYVDLFSAPGRQIFLIVQCLSSYTLGSAILTFILMVTHLNEIIILYHQHLKRMIEQVPMLKTRALRKRQIKICVRLHVFIIETNHRLNHFFKQAYMVHVIFTPLNLSVIAYQLLGREIILSSIVHIVTYIITIALNCIGAERLTLESSTLMDTVYSAVPFDGDVETQRDLRFILERSQIFLHVQSGKFGYVGHILMSNIFKSVFSMLTLLKKME